MFAVAYTIAASTIPGAGKGVFAREDLQPGRVIVFPNERHALLTEAEVSRLPPGSVERASAIRWFEGVYTVDPHWSDESYLNHSFTPNALWVLGFVIAAEPIPAGTEITIDYRMLLGDGQDAEFRDAATGRPVIGLTFAEAMAAAGETLRRVFAAGQRPD